MYMLHGFTFLGEFLKEGVVEAAGESGQVASGGEPGMNPASSGSPSLVHELQVNRIIISLL